MQAGGSRLAELPRSTVQGYVRMQGGQLRSDGWEPCRVAGRWEGTGVHGLGAGCSLAKLLIKMQGRATACIKLATYARLSFRTYRNGGYMPDMSSLPIHPTPLILVQPT